MCGCAIYQYEHLDPPFAEATEHQASGITLLCGGCHDRATRRLLSLDSIKRAMQAPRCLADGFSFGPFDLGIEHPEVLAGAFLALRTRIILRAFGDPILAVDPPEEPAGPFQLSATLCDDQGTVVLRIDRNEWQAPVDNWDVEVIGQRITVRRAEGDITLRLRSEPPHRLVIERLHMYYHGANITCHESSGLVVRTPTGQTFQVYAATGIECEVGIDVRETGLSIGCGCKSMHIGMATLRR